MSKSLIPNTYTVGENNIAIHQKLAIIFGTKPIVNFTQYCDSNIGFFAPHKAFALPFFQ